MEKRAWPVDRVATVRRRIGSPRFISCGGQHGFHPMLPAARQRYDNSSSKAAMPRCNDSRDPFNSSHALVYYSEYRFDF